MRKLLRGLQSGSHGTQMGALSELCEMLSMGTDDAMSPAQACCCSSLSQRLPLSAVAVCREFGRTELETER